MKGLVAFWFSLFLALLASLCAMLTTSWMFVDLGATDFRSHLLSIDVPGQDDHYRGYWIAGCIFLLAFVVRLSSKTSQLARAVGFRLILLGLIGLSLVAAYFSLLLVEDKGKSLGLTAAAASGTACHLPREACTGGTFGSECSEVNNLPESEFLGIPVSILGIVGYSFLALAAFVLLFVQGRAQVLLMIGLWVAVLAFVSMSLWLIPILSEKGLACARCYMMHTAHAGMLMCLIIGGIMIGRRQISSSALDWLACIGTPILTIVGGFFFSLQALDEMTERTISYCKKCITYDGAFDCEACCNDPQLGARECDRFDDSCMPLAIGIEGEKDASFRLRAVHPPKLVQKHMAEAQVFNFPEKGPTIGKNRINIHFTVFEDFHCPACADLYVMLRTLLDEFDWDFSVSFHDFPLIDGSKKDHQIGWALHEESGFAFLEIFMEQIYSAGLPAEEALDIALSDSGMGVSHRNRILQHSRSKEAEAAIDRSLALGRSLKIGGQPIVTSTPGIFVNGVYLDLKGLPSLNQLRSLIKSLSTGSSPEGSVSPSKKSATISDDGTKKNANAP